MFLTEINRNGSTYTFVKSENDTAVKVDVEKDGNYHFSVTVDKDLCAKDENLLMSELNTRIETRELRDAGMSWEAIKELRLSRT